MHATRTLSSGAVAELRDDPLRPGAFELTIDGSPQSNVAADPRELAYDYVRRMASAIDAFAPDGAPVRVLHLGAGALTLPRYVAATRPGSHGTVVEIEAGLCGFVLEHAPLPVGATVEILEADALTALRGEHRADLVVADVYRGETLPDRLVGPALAEGCARAAPLTLVNVADDRGAPLTARLAALFAATHGRVVAVGEPALFDGRTDGNAVLLAGRLRSGGDGFSDALARMLRDGPHPVARRPERDVVVVEVPVEVDP
jgi:hypothetical protein